MNEGFTLIGWELDGGIENGRDHVPLNLIHVDSQVLASRAAFLTWTEFLVKPCARLLPVSLDTAIASVEEMANLFLRHSSKETILDNSSQGRIEDFKSIQGLIDCENLWRALGRLD